jgi:hypothetical protein
MDASQNNEQTSSSLVRRPTVVQAHVKLPTLRKHQRLSVGGHVCKPFHEAADFTLAKIVRGWPSVQSLSAGLG